MRYRVFRSHGGKLYIVRLSDEEIREKRRYFAGCAVTTLIFSATLVIASGIF